MDVTGLITDIDGFIVNPYEAGIFIASIASLKIISLDIDHPEKLADEYNDKWLNYISDSYKVYERKPPKNLLKLSLRDECNDKWLKEFICDLHKVNEQKPDKNLLKSRCLRNCKVYGNLYLEIMTAQTDEKKRQIFIEALGWPLFQNCTGKKAPTDFTKFLFYNTGILKCAVKVFQTIKT